MRDRSITEMIRRCRAIPTLVQLPEKSHLYEKLPDDCRREVDRHLAAESLKARLQVFDVQDELEQLKLEPRSIIRCMLGIFAAMVEHDGVQAVRHASFE